MESYENRIVYDSGLEKHASVARVLTEGRWSWPVPNTWELIEVVQGTNSLFPNPNQPDSVIWDPTKGAFTTSSTCSLLLNNHPLVGWHELVWHKRTIPRQAIALWLAILHRLST